ncbi:MAG: hypothetical protein EHM64_03255 [Ignavibacteriae bacterium]|nr:MAG: hypothetical protein EHM64_03255 [Ignavibacteriota bacterium]
MIIFIKTIHTIIWVIMALSVFYIGYCVVLMNYTMLFYAALFLIGTESLVIVLNAWKCPLTGIARNYTDEQTANFDIYLPETVARYNKEIFSAILFLILLLYLYHRLT